ncbi:MAG: endonuclease/exonuclease/phosphatase family protein [Clostridia bacterium]|nr:endonuclease/exonuclease/phosphatase family protein [Clostridia bacterium]
MKIMTFNTQHCLNYIKQEIDFRIMADAILQCGADIVGLQEMLAASPEEEYTNQVPMLAKLTGMQHHYFAEAIALDDVNSYGNGLLSKYPIREAETIPIPDPDPHQYDGYYETRCVLKAKLENGITVLVSHFGLNPDERESAVKTILANLEKEKCILMGDLNVCPDDPVLDPIRERMKDTADLFAGPRLSFPSDNPNQKIDYIFVTPDIEVVSADIPAIVASDHRPHTAEIHI